MINNIHFTSRLKGVAWISVNRPSSRTDRSRSPSVFQLQMEWTDLQTKGHTVSKQMIVNLATKHNTTCGKWLFYAKTGEEVDKVWSKIAKSIYNGTIQSASAKVSPVSPGKPDHVICVYNDDFTDHDAVLTCERDLRGLGITHTMYYKPDVYTYLNIYSSNKWGLKPTIYTSYFNKGQGKSQIKNRWWICNINEHFYAPPPPRMEFGCI